MEEDLFPSDDRELLAYLRSIMPRRIEELSTQCIETVDKFRQQLIFISRSNIVLPLSYAQTYPQDILPSRRDIVSQILSRKTISTQEATPAFIQQTALLISHIHNNLPLFAVAVINRHGKNDYHFLIYSVVPAIFGFFTSGEQCKLAGHFYTAVMETTKPKTAIEIIRPFFSSIGTFSFIESIMKPFTQSFGGDFRYENPKNHEAFFKYHSDNIVNLIIQAIPLLPSHHQKLLKFCTTLQWSQEDFNELFFTRFFSYQANLWITASPYGQRQSLFNKILELVVVSPLIRESIDKTPKSYHFPSIYTCFDQKYMSFCLTVSDVMVAIKVFSEYGNLPLAVKDISFDRFTMEKRYRVYWVRIFPKRPLKKCRQDNVPQHLIFNFHKKEIPNRPEFERRFLQISTGYTKTRIGETHTEFDDYCVLQSLNSMFNLTTLFENLMVYRYQLKVLKELVQKAIDQDTFFNANIAIKTAITARDSITDLKEALTRSAQNFKNSKEIQRLQFYIIIAREIKLKMSLLSDQIEELETEWSNIMEYKRNNMTSPVEGMKEPMQSFFWENVTMIQYLNNIPMPYQMVILNDFLHRNKAITDIFKSSMDLLMTCASLSDCVILPSRLLFFNEYIIKNPEYKKLRFEEEELLWTNFESCFLKYIATKETLKFQNMYLEFQQHFTQ